MLVQGAVTVDKASAVNLCVGSFSRPAGAFLAPGGTVRGGLREGTGICGSGLLMQTVSIV